MLQFSSEQRCRDVKYIFTLPYSTNVTVMYWAQFIVHVWVYACLLGPTTYCKWKYFKKIAAIRSWVKDYCQQFFYLLHPFWGHSKSRNGKWEQKKRKCRAVGAGSAGLAVTGPIFDQPTCASCVSFSRSFDSCSKRTLAGILEESCHMKDFWWGMEANTLCCLKKDPIKP